MTRGDDAGGLGGGLIVPKGYGLSVHEALSSTNKEALARAASGETGPVWIIAHRQGSGYGRRGRAWASAPGDLACTLLTRGPAQSGALGHLAFVAGLAVHDAAAAVADPEALRLKWPNDLLLKGGKLAGLLIEREGDAIAVGFGVNIVSAPEDAPYATARLGLLDGDLPQAISLRRRVFNALAAAWDRRRAEWAEGVQFELTRAAWLARAHGLGAPMEVRLPSETLTGAFAGLDSDGRLILKAKDGTARAIAAGDVFFDVSARAEET